MTSEQFPTHDFVSIQVGGLERIPALSESSYVFQTREWLNLWLDTYGRTQNITPVVFDIQDRHDSGRLILPLAIRNLGPGVRVLTVLGGFHADYAGAQLSGDPRYLNAKTCWTAIDNWARTNKIDLISIPRIPEFIGQQPNPLASPDLLPCENSGQISLPQGWPEFYNQRFKTRVKADIRRQMKRLSALGTLSFRTASTLQEALQLTTTMIEQKRIRYREMGVTDQFCHSEAYTLYHRLTETLWPTGVVHVAGLFVDQDVIATHWGAQFQNRFYYLMPAHQGGEWTKYSPGKLLLQHLVEHAATQGCTVFDLTVGGESYKDDWCDSNMRLVRYEKTITLTGRLIALALQAKKHLQARALYVTSTAAHVRHARATP